MLLTTVNLPETFGIIVKFLFIELTSTGFEKSK